MTAELVLGNNSMLADSVRAQNSGIDTALSRTKDHAIAIGNICEHLIADKEEIEILKQDNLILKKIVAEQQKAIVELQKAAGIKPAPLQGRVSPPAPKTQSPSVFSAAWRLHSLRTVIRRSDTPKPLPPGTVATIDPVQRAFVAISKLLWDILYENNVYTVAGWIPLEIAKTLVPNDDSPIPTHHAFNLNHFGNSFLGEIRHSWALSAHMAYPWGPWNPHFTTALMIEFFLSANFSNPQWKSHLEQFLKAYQPSSQEKAALLSKQLERLAYQRMQIEWNSKGKSTNQKSLTPLGMQYHDLSKATDDLTRALDTPETRERIELMLAELYLRRVFKLMESGHLLAASEACTLMEQRLKPLAYLLEPLPSITGPAASQEQAPNAQFVPGQPVQLRNDGSSCFIDAPFWILMNAKPVADAVIDSCQRWDASFLAFERLTKWVVNKQDNSKPAAQDLALLLPMFANEEFGKLWYASTIGKRADQEALKAFDASMRAFTAARQENIADPVLSEADLVALSLAFDEFRPEDFIRSEDFKGIFQIQQRKAEAIRFFPRAAAHYQQCCESQKAHSGLCLSPLRSMMPDGLEDHQQDGEEWLRKVYQIIDRRRYPHCFFREATVRHFIEYDPSKDDPIKAQQQVERLKLYQTINAPADFMDPSGNIHHREELTYGLFAGIPQVQEVEIRGQDLMDQLFVPRIHAQNEPMIYKDPETGAYKLYKIESERTVIGQLPDHMLFTLRRFNANRAKNDATVVMPQTLKVRGADYDVTAILLHEGTAKGGHYTSLVKKGAIWWFCDDTQASIEPADPVKLKTALEKGYSYFLKRIADANI